jgi:hypothetical protein
MLTRGKLSPTLTQIQLIRQMTYILFITQLKPVKQNPITVNEPESSRHSLLELKL